MTETIDQDRVDHIERLSAQLRELRRKLDEAEQAIQAIQTGQADPLIVHGPQGPADSCYRVLVEAMHEGAATLHQDGTILYCNPQFADMLDTPLERVIGSPIQRFLAQGAETEFALLVGEAQAGHSRGETQLMAPSGRPIPALLWLSFANGGASSKLCLIATDLRAQKRTERIVVAERLARSVIEQAAEAVIVCDNEGRIIRAGAAAERLSRLNPLRRYFDDVFEIEIATLNEPDTPPVRFRIAMVTEAAAQGRVIRAAAATLVRPDRSRADLLLSATILRGAGSRVHGYIINLVDVSDYKRAKEALRQSEERFRIALRDSPVMVSTQDLLFRYTWQHNALLGHSDEAVIGKTDPELFPPDAAAHVMALKRQAVVSGEPVRDFVSVTRDGEALFFDFIVEPQRDATGTIVGITNVVIEVTERKRTEDALREANLRLADADRRKNEFLAVLSHELRNPLSTITNSLYILERSPPGSSQAQRAKLVMNRQTGQLSRLVDDLLDVTRFSRNKIRLKLEGLELNELVRQSTEDHLPLFEKSGINIEFVSAPGPVYVNVDVNRMAQIVGNLLQNAAKFTDPGGHASISVSADPEQNVAFVHVKDTGAGIAPHVLDKLFLPFMQAEQTLDRTKGGLGLGLALVHDMVLLHGGTISAHSAGIGKGAEFTVRLPLDSDTGRLTTEPVPNGQTCRHILIVEDNVDAAETLRDVLEFGGHNVHVAYSAREGLAYARQHHPNVVLCDIGLPGMDGYDFAREFRANEELKDSVLVALTGYAMPEDLQRAAQAGFDKHLAKPASFEKIDEMLRELPQPQGSYPSPGGPKAHPQG